MTITVGELRDLLEDEDDDAIVILSKDGEGNEYSPVVAEFTPCKYLSDNSWCGEIIGQENEDFDMADGVAALVLWPTN